MKWFLFIPLASCVAPNLACLRLRFSVYALFSISKGFGKLTWHLLLFANSHNKMQRIKIGHLQGNWHLNLAKDKNRRSSGARAFLARDFARTIGFAKPSTAWHFCQVCSLICQVTQIANSKCKTVGYLFWSFLANYSNANLKCKTLGDALIQIHIKKL